MKKSIKLTKSKEIFFGFNIIFYYFSQLNVNKLQNACLLVLFLLFNRYIMYCMCKDNTWRKRCQEYMLYIILL